MQHQDRNALFLHPHLLQCRRRRPHRFPSGCTLLLGAGIVPRLFFLSVTRKLTTIRHSGLDSHSGQNPAIENIPDNDDANQVKQIHISSPLCFSVLRGRRSVNQSFDFTLKKVKCATILPQCLHLGGETICLAGKFELLQVIVDILCDRLKIELDTTRCTRRGILFPGTPVDQLQGSFSRCGCPEYEGCDATGPEHLTVTAMEEI